MVINPCNCGGLPYTYPYYAPDDIYKEDEWCAVTCMRCDTELVLGFTIELAITEWNKGHNYELKTLRTKSK